MEEGFVIDLAWLGGVFDGEGAISLSCNTTPVGSVSIGNSDPQLLYNCMCIAIAIGCPVCSKLRNGQGFSLVWTGCMGTEFLLKVLPFMRNGRQRQRASIYREFFNPARKYTRQRKLRTSLWKQWREFTHKGPPGKEWT